MAIRDLQAKLAEMGRIRIGHRVPKASGSGTRPAKLDRFKFTSEAEHLITAVAELYGGTVEPYTGEGVRGRQFAVVTDAHDIPVYLPRQSIDPFYEQWARGVCTRRCDGERDQVHDNPCDCNPEKRACKPTTRANVMLADVPGIGVWRLESHGIYTAMEMSQLAPLLERAPMPIPGRLMLQARARKFYNREEGKVESRDWFTPVLLIDSVTARQAAIGGDALTQAIRAVDAAAIEAARATPALEAAPARPAEPDPELIRRGLDFIANCEPDGMDDARERIRRMGDPAELVAAFQQRLGEQKIEEQRKARAIAAEQERMAQESATVREMEHVAATLEAETALGLHPEPEGPSDGHSDEGGAQADDDEFAAAWNEADSPIDSEPQAPAVEDDPADKSAALMEALGYAAKLRMPTSAIDDLVQEKFGRSRHLLNLAQLRELAAELRERVK